MRTIETAVYQYEELSESAKETARQWYLSDWDFFEYDHVIEDAQTYAEIIGIEFDTRKATLNCRNLLHVATQP